MRSNEAGQPLHQEEALTQEGSQKSPKSVAWLLFKESQSGEVKRPQSMPQVRRR